MDELIWRVDWESVFTPTHSVLELVARGTAMYFLIVLLLRLVMKRQSGGVGRTDILVIVLVAELSGPGFATDYRSVTEGAVLLVTVLFWSYALEWLTYCSPRFERFFAPPTLTLIRDGKMLHRNMRAELITKEELMAQLRENGIRDVASVKEACMESDGMISVVRKDGN